MEKICKKAIVRGRVQGVGFRFSTRLQAGELGVSGWAKNLHDGSVEVVMCGEASAVMLLTNWLGTGPSSSVVTSVDVEDMPCQHLTGFTTL